MNLNRESVIDIEPKEIRCKGKVYVKGEKKECNKMLARGVVDSLEIKCPRCKTMNKFKQL
jgi:phage FluMu protein Com